MTNTLDRFHDAQQHTYATALDEIKHGRKENHWMWYIFPQIVGLGRSAISQKYAIKDMKEARLYLEDETLRKNLIEISEALLQLDTDDATEIMGWPDDMKLQSSMTLFALADSDCGVFQNVLDKFYGGKKCEKTIEILKS